MKLPELKRNIVDLRDSIQENKETVDKLNVELKKIQSDNKELQSYVSQLNNDNEALVQANQKLVMEKNRANDEHSYKTQKFKVEMNELIQEKKRLEMKLDKVTSNLNELKKQNNIIIESKISKLAIDKDLGS